MYPSNRTTYSMQPGITWSAQSMSPGRDPSKRRNSTLAICLKSRSRSKEKVLPSPITKPSIQSSRDRGSSIKVPSESCLHMEWRRRVRKVQRSQGGWGSRCQGSARAGTLVNSVTITWGMRKVREASLCKTVQTSHLQSSATISTTKPTRKRAIWARWWVTVWSPS